MELMLEALLIVSLRVVDVSIGTIRIILLTRGSRWRASGLGFVEVLIWVFAVALVVQKLDDPVRMVAFALGFSLGTLLGATIERWIAIGTVLVQAVAPTNSPSSAEALRSRGFRVTEVNGEGRDGEVRLVVLVIPRRELKTALGVIQSANPAAFVTVADVALAPQWQQRSWVSIGNTLRSNGKVGAASGGESDASRGSPASRTSEGARAPTASAATSTTTATTTTVNLAPTHRARQLPL